jgi:transcriptional regulator with XRE-family HTH domain
VQIRNIDLIVGGRIRERRIVLGLTQRRLAEQVGTTYQQVHKYERGINSVSAGRLYQLATVLKAPVDWFFDGIGKKISRKLTTRERVCLELARNFGQIASREHQAAVSQLARALSTPGKTKVGASGD